MTRRPGRGFRLGGMTERIEIQQIDEETVDDFGQPGRTWNNDGGVNVSAKVETVSGGEVLRGRQIIQGVNKLFTIRKRPDDVTLTSRDRILYNSQYYGIVLITPVESEGRSRYLEIQAKITDGQSNKR